MLNLLDPNTKVQGAVRQLQGETVDLIAGGAINTKLDIAAIRRLEDAIQSVIHNTAGVLVDVTSEASISNINATGTITLASLLAGDEVVVDGASFTAIDGDGFGANSGQSNSGNYQFGIGASDNESAANLAAAIAQRMSFVPGGVDSSVATNVVTVDARIEGAAGNAIALTESTAAARITLSGATLTGGTDTGGIELDTTDTTGDQLMVTWYDKQ